MATRIWFSIRIGQRLVSYRHADLEIHVCKYLIRDDVWLIYLLGTLMLIRIRWSNYVYSFHCINFVDHRRLRWDQPPSRCNPLGAIYLHLIPLRSPEIIQRHLLYIIHRFASAGQRTPRFRFSSEDAEEARRQQRLWISFWVFHSSAKMDTPNYSIYYIYLQSSR